MSGPRNSLSDFGRERVRQLGEQRHGDTETPSSLRVLTAFLLRLSGDMASLLVILTIIIAPVIAMYQFATSGTFNTASWPEFLLELGAWFMYANAARWLADYLGYEDWWGWPI